MSKLQRYIDELAQLDSHKISNVVNYYAFFASSPAQICKNCEALFKIGVTNFFEYNSKLSYMGDDDKDYSLIFCYKPPSASNSFAIRNFVKSVSKDQGIELFNILDYLSMVKLGLRLQKGYVFSEAQYLSHLNYFMSLYAIVYNNVSVREATSDSFFDKKELKNHKLYPMLFIDVMMKAFATSLVKDIDKILNKLNDTLSLSGVYFSERRVEALVDAFHKFIFHSGYATPIFPQFSTQRFEAQQKKQQQQLQQQQFQHYPPIVAKQEEAEVVADRHYHQNRHHHQNLPYAHHNQNSSSQEFYHHNSSSNSSNSTSSSSNYHHNENKYSPSIRSGNSSSSSASGYNIVDRNDAYLRYNTPSGGAATLKHEPSSSGSSGISGSSSSSSGNSSSAYQQQHNRRIKREKSITPPPPPPPPRPPQQSNYSLAHYDSQPSAKRRRLERFEEVASPHQQQQQDQQFPHQQQQQFANPYASMNNPYAAAAINPPPSNEHALPAVSVAAAVAVANNNASYESYLPLQVPQQQIIPQQRYHHQYSSSGAVDLNKAGEEHY